MAETKAQLGLLKVSNQREEKGKATQQLSAQSPGVQQSSWATRKPETLSEALSRMAEKGKENLSIQTRLSCKLWKNMASICFL